MKKEVLFEASWIKVPFKTAKGEDIPYIKPIAHQGMAHAIGDILLSWSLMDGLVTASIAALVETGSTAETGWQKLETAKRLRLYDDLFREAVQRAEVLSYHAKTMNKIWSAKGVRDLLAHERISWGTYHDGTPWIKFLTSKLGRRGQSPFTLADLGRTSSEIDQASGRLNFIGSAEAEASFASEDKPALLRLRGKDHSKTPIQRAFERQPRP